MCPKFLTGDMVVTEPFTTGSRPGLVLAVKRANELPDDRNDIMKGSYPWVYYVMLHSGHVQGPLFSAQMHHV